MEGRSEAFVSDSDHVKILVLGDTGVGKSCLVHLLCSGKVLSYSPWTSGANVDVLLFEHPLSRKKFFVEFFDVGGSARYEVARGVFYSNPDGIIFVHDLSNEKSRTNLKKWVRELALNLDPDSTYSWSKSGGESDTAPILDLNYRNGASLPVLVVGNKADLARSRAKDQSSLEDGTYQIEISATDESSVSENSAAQQTLRSFYQRVVDAKLRPSANQNQITRNGPSTAFTLASGITSSNRALPTATTSSAFTFLGNRKV